MLWGHSFAPEEWSSLLAENLSDLNPRCRHNGSRSFQKLSFHKPMRPSLQPAQLLTFLHNADSSSYFSLHQQWRVPHVVHQPVQEVLPTDHPWRAVNLISPFKRIGPEPSCLWELADAVCRRNLTQTGPNPVGVHSCRKAHQSLAGPSGSSHRWQLTLCPRQFACLLSRGRRFLPVSSILCSDSNEDISALLLGCHPDQIKMNGWSGV